jgi:hypothetical protein
VTGRSCGGRGGQNRSDVFRMLLSWRGEGAKGRGGLEGPGRGVEMGVGVGVGRRGEELTRTVASLCSNPHIPYDHREVTLRVSSGMGASGGE